MGGIVGQETRHYRPFLIDPEPEKALIPTVKSGLIFSLKMEKNETMVLYVTHYETIKMLPQEEQLLTLKAIIEYSFYDIEPQIEGVPQIVFMMAKPNIDASKRRRTQARINGLKGASHGQKGGRPKSEFICTETPTGVISETPMGVIPETPTGVILKTPKKPLNVNVNVNVKENVNVNGKVNGKEKDIDVFTPKGVTPSNDFSSKTETEQSAKQKKQDTQVAGGGADAEPKTKPFSRWDRNDLAQAIAPYVAKYGKVTCNEFFKYWAEPTASGKMRVNIEKAFDTSRRLATWQKNNNKFSTQGAKQDTQMPTPKFKTKQEAEQWVIDTYYHGRRELSALGMGVSLTGPDNQPRPIEDIRKDVEQIMTSYQS